MEEKIITFLTNIGNKYGPAIVAGSVGAVIARLRRKMSIKQFIGSLIISVFVSISVGAVCKDYLLIKQESLINVLCGVSGVFSKIILNELEDIIKDIAIFARIKLGIPEKHKKK